MTQFFSSFLAKLQTENWPTFHFNILQTLLQSKEISTPISNSKLVRLMLPIFQTILLISSLRGTTCQLFAFSGFLRYLLFMTYGGNTKAKRAKKKQRNFQKSLVFCLPRNNKSKMLTFWHRAIRFDWMKSQETSKWNVFVEISPTSKAKSISLVTSVELWDDYWSIHRQSVTESRKLSKTKQCGIRFEQLALTPSHYSRGIISDWNVASRSNHSSRNGRGCYRFGFRPALNWRCEFDHFQDDSDDCDYDGYDYAKSLQNSIEKTSQNLKVTVVPDIPSNAALRDPSFDATLASDPELEKCFQSLKQTWNTCEFEERHPFFAKIEIINLVSF